MQSKHRERLLKKDLLEIQEEAENDDDEDDDGLANEGMSLGNFLKSRQKKKVAFAPQEEEDDADGDNVDDDAEEEIDFDTYKRQFEAEMAEKIKMER